jgi:D-glycero-alpha-D-manno-heptose-7-phosphate kinase
MIDASVPVRICDLGGWTDTWFGGPGRVVNLAVRPGVSVTIRGTGGAGAVQLEVEDRVDRYPIVPGASRSARQPLLEAAIDARPPPDGVGLAVTIRSAVPPGCGAGTSAAVAVALLGALAAVRSEPASPRELAYAAHRLEVDVLGRQSGVQDQLSAAFGGINYLEIDRYPQATVCPLPLWAELGERLVLVFVGRAHDSSGTHEQVIRSLRTGESGALERLRTAAVAARDAVQARDLRSFGQAMIANTKAQDALHPDLVGADARRVIELAAQEQALGWKVNGAGGDGGSVTILAPSPEATSPFVHRVTRLDPRYRVLPVELSPTGLDVRGELEVSERGRIGD